LKPLGALVNLKDLTLGGNPITDAGAAHLKKLTNLKDLKLTGSRVSDDGAQELKKALPQTRILDASGSEVSLAREDQARSRPKVIVEDLTRVPPTFSLTAGQLSAEYKKDRNGAGEQYNNKVIELTGVVERFGRDISGGVHVYLRAGEKLENVNCITVDDEPWSRVLPGQTIKVKGKGTEFAIAPSLIDCVFVETGPYQPTVLTAEQLAKEFAADPEAVNKKYENKYLILTGEIVSREYNSVGASSVVLKTAGKLKVGCSFTAFEKDLTKPLKVGQKIKVIGRYAHSYSKDEVNLYFCLPFKKP
jgi:hypothetical protein